MVTSGKFEVSLSPMDVAHPTDNPVCIGRMSINKVFSGGLTGNSKGEMLSVRSSTPGSAGYVAMEEFEGTLDGKKGRFFLQHFGTMSAQGQHLLLEVVPDTGEGELEGISGNMNIQIDNGEHSYHFEYQLPGD